MEHSAQEAQAEAVTAEQAAQQAKETAEIEVWVAQHAKAMAKAQALQAIARRRLKCVLRVRPGKALMRKHPRHGKLRRGLRPYSRLGCTSGCGEG